MTEAFKKHFEDADADNDRHLSQQEYFTFCAKMKALQEEKGLPTMDQSEEYQTRMWTVMNKINDKYSGVAPGDIGISRSFQ